MEDKKYIYLVQVTRQLSIDILNAFAKHSKNVVLLTGSIEKQHTGLHDSIKIMQFNRYDSSGIISRVISGLWFHIRCFFYVLFYGRNDELILVSTPPFLPFLGLFSYRLRKQKYHLLIWDLYPDVLVRMNKVKATSFLNRFWSRRNTLLFKHCSSLITLGNQMADSIRAYTDKKVHIIPPWADTSYVKSVEEKDNVFIRANKLENKFVVMYAGNLGITHPVETLIKIAGHLKSDERFAFVIIGEGEKKKLLQKLMGESKLSNVILLPYQDPEMFPHALAAATVSVVTLSSSAADVSVPSKTFTSLAAGSALLAIGPAESGLSEIISKYHCGEIYREHELNSITSWLSQLADDPENLNLYRQRSLDAASHFTLANASAYYHIISQN